MQLKIAVLFFFAVILAVAFAAPVAQVAPTGLNLPIVSNLQKIFQFPKLPDVNLFRFY